MAQVVVRRQFVLKGVTQGVGFRPTIFRFARGFALGGFIRNDSDGVTIEVEGAPDEVAGFAAGLGAAIPRLARIDSREERDCTPAGGVAFVIEESGEPRGGVPPIPADIAICPECRGDLFNPNDRRHGHAFTTCTLCGPRFTIVRGAPYDRGRTSMGAFAMCAGCAREYADPADRRFHSETNSCPACGPRLTLCGPGGETIASDAEAIRGAAAALARGAIVAVKGIGGFHLACDAMNAGAIEALRTRKGRAEKPFAVMTASVGEAKRIAALTAEDEDLLGSPVAPIVIAPRAKDCPLPSSIAPGNGTVGVFVAYTPLHALLFEAFRQLSSLRSPASGLGTHALVMTSGNRSDEPIAIGNHEALERLKGIADLFLVHDRDILCRADDSIFRPIGGRHVVFRRARGIVPEGIRVGVEGPDVLALGGELKNTVAVLAGEYVYPSPHIGDLETAEAFDHFTGSIGLMTSFVGARPTVVACDMHPDYLSTKHAEDMTGAKVVKVQHHHAHVAACMAEHALSGEVVGVSFDGTGYGPDGTVWGGEFLVADYGGCRRVGHLAQVPMPGGAQSIREPFRMAAAFLGLGWDGPLPTRVLENLGLSEEEFGVFAALAKVRDLSPLTSSAGRLFDAVAAIAGVARLSTFEGQAAMALEQAAAGPGIVQSSYQGRVRRAGGKFVVNTPDLVRQAVEDVVQGAAPETIAKKFHAALASAVMGVCLYVKRETGLDRAVLSGGVFQNAILSELCENALTAAGFTVYIHARLPPNDGGISTGQAVVAREVARCASRYRCEW